MGYFGAAHGLGGGGAKKAPLPKITINIYLKEIQKIYESRDTPLEFR